jgi:tripartite-type tricarboxylate transporter receptor subunit TctC
MTARSFHRGSPFIETPVAGDYRAVMQCLPGGIGMTFTNALQRVVASLAVVAAATTAAWAQSYPARPVKMIVPFAAGGPADIFARELAQYMSEDLKQSFVVEDRPGAGSILGTEAVARAAPDGYTLLLMSNTHTTNESLIPNKPFALMRDFVAVAPINYSDLLMVVHPSVPAKDLKEFIALAKGKPGELNYASSGPGTPYHMAGELFKAMSGTNIVHVPYKGSGDARNAVIGGHVQMMIDAITTMASNARGGQVRALGTTGLKRSTVMPDVPTIAEAGVPGYEATIWLGLMAPAATPKPIVDRLNAEIAKIVSRADLQKMWAEQGAVPMLMEPSQFDKYLRADIAKWAHVVEVSGAKVE